MFFIVAIIDGINATICGINVSRRSMSGINCWMSSVMVSIPSRVSNIDRIAQHDGMS
ncbi:hypothetical protein BN977_03863 [Mycolicibacterium cosmeticum]|uniref:Uncharacterized protein n=1 Tax=Mycolicibacterium cosmeticum TaxID=258533 RepID=W9AU55_MYCCO|nr:hypothetical protein BN977_03863 [Mycolicibacterium cosmeticum]